MCGTFAKREALIADIGQKIQNTSTIDDALKVAVRELGNAFGLQRTSVQVSLTRDDKDRGRSRD